MKLRFAEEMTIHLIIPEGYDDREIPPMLFISHIENAFKYGSSYQHESFINIVFEITENKLSFNCINTKHSGKNKNTDGGLGLINSENRLKLLFGTNYSLAINSTEKLFNVSLEIPLS
jgi:LytS/YehU family sensor histidine kinase